MLNLLNNNNKKHSKFKVIDHVRISKYKNIFVTGYVLNWTEDVLGINKVENAVSRKYVN